MELRRSGVMEMYTGVARDLSPSLPNIQHGLRTCLSWSESWWGALTSPVARHHLSFSPTFQFFSFLLILIFLPNTPTDILSPWFCPISLMHQQLQQCGCSPVPQWYLWGFKKYSISCSSCSQLDFRCHQSMVGSPSYSPVWKCAV